MYLVAKPLPFLITRLFRSRSISELIIILLLTETEGIYFSLDL